MALLRSPGEMGLFVSKIVGTTFIRVIVTEI